MKLYRIPNAVLVEAGGALYRLEGVQWDALLNRENLQDFLRVRLKRSHALPSDSSVSSFQLLAPLEGQEVWAAGVTYYRSRDARMEEAEQAGGGDFYDRVYRASRPELFFKATPHRVAGPDQPVRIRRDARWSVPEPELALVVSSRAQIIGYSIGNDMSSRDIEGENPLYLPQAKIYDGSCALGPGILLSEQSLPAETRIRMEILRDAQVTFEGVTSLAQLKRKPAELVEFLFREASFPRGCFLLTGTGIVPPADFSLRKGDEIRISIEGIGQLINTVTEQN